QLGVVDQPGLVRLGRHLAGVGSVGQGQEQGVDRDDHREEGDHGGGHVPATNGEAAFRTAHRWLPKAKAVSTVWVLSPLRISKAASWAPSPAASGGAVTNTRTEVTWLGASSTCTGPSP